MAYAVDIALQNNIERISGAILADQDLNNSKIISNIHVAYATKTASKIN